MAKFKGVSYLDGGPDLIRTRAATPSRIKLHLLSAYASNDSYATCLTRSIGNADIVPGNVVSTGASGADRITTFASKSIVLTAAQSGTPDLHYAVLDSVSSEVHLVVDESSNPTSMEVAGIATSAAFTDTIRQSI